MSLQTRTIRRTRALLSSFGALALIFTTVLGLAFPALLGGAVFVETVFSWPGMGRMVTAAIAVRDYPLVLAAVIVGAGMVTLGNLIADIGYALADPRVRAR